MSNKLTRVVFIIVLTVLIVIGGFFMNGRTNKDYKRYQTESGLTVLSTKDKSLPYIKYEANFKQAGADHVPEDKSGLAYLTAYLLDQGAGDLNSEQIQKELNQLGTELSVLVGRDMVTLSLEGLSWHKKKLFELFKKIIVSPRFEEKELEVLREQFLTIRKSSLDQPSYVANVFLNKSLFDGRFANPSKGNLISLSEIHLEDIKTFYKTNYKEGNPIFSLAGHFDSSFEKEFYQFVNQNFSYYEKKLEQKPEPAVNKSQFQLLTKNNLVQAEVRFFYFLFPFPKEDFKSYLSLLIANKVLGGAGFTAHLMNELREKRGLTYGVYSSPRLRKNYGVFYIEGATKNSSVREFIEQVLVVLEKIKKEGISEEELNDVKNQLRVDYLKQIESPENKIDRVLYFLEYLGLDAKDIENYLETLKSITLEEVNSIFDTFVLSKSSEKLQSFTDPTQNNDKAYLQVLVYGDPSIESQLQDIKGLPSLEVLSFKEQFGEELDFLKTKQAE